jgi:hypothetical protein
VPETDDPSPAAAERFRVTYRVRSLIDGGLVHEHAVVVAAADEQAAGRAAVAWAHEHDSHVDDRLQPLVEVGAVESADPDDAFD